ncbi:aldo/keto reductase [Propioniciclava soli]|uniref:aldo/keto reductase n=1 Tax=Propioniciclava soli TaxID=2775081 RepID=UPI001E3EB0B9|nr:aldo/keto reductase [Propioniciclava soli]
METRRMERLGLETSVIGMGCWQIGGSWGEVGQDDALATLHAAADAGVTFFDTADVYGDGRSEQLVGRFVKQRPAGSVVVATKMGRRADPHEASAYTLDAFRRWIDRSRENLDVAALDLVQLHCPPSEVFASPQVFEALETLVAEGRIRAYGVSVERCDEALTALEHPGLASIQIIVNAFRHKPLERVLPAAAEAGVGVIARVPLASGLLSGRYDADTTFAADDHRSFNRHGEQFDRGETFSGVPYDVGVAAAQEFSALAPEGVTPAQFALRWLVDTPGVSVVIPGARNPEQARANAAAGSLAPVTDAQRAAVAALYEERIAEHVHASW